MWLLHAPAVLLNLACIVHAWQHGLICAVVCDAAWLLETGQWDRPLLCLQAGGNSVLELSSFL